MKRVNETVEGGSENLGLKKVRFSTGIDDNSGALERNEGEKDLVENGGVDSAEVDRNGDPFGSIASDDFDDPNLGGPWDFDLNLDLFFGNEEEQKGFGFDLNVPVNSTLDGGTEKGCLEDTRGPMINGNKPQIINIASDDSDNEVEIIGASSGYNEKGKQKEIGSPYWFHDRELKLPSELHGISLGLGLTTMHNVGETSLAAGGQRRYTREEKGKATVDYSFLSLKGNCFIDLDSETDSDDSIRTTDSAEDVVGTLQPEPLAAMANFRQRAPRRANRELEMREPLLRSRARETARNLARVNPPDRSNGNESSSQIQPPTSGIVGQLGNCPGPFSEALKVVRERTLKLTAEQLIEWKPLGQDEELRSAALVPSLLDLSLKVLAENAEGIVSLEVVPDHLRRRLTDMLCDARKMNVHILDLLIEGCPSEIRIKNSSNFPLALGRVETYIFEVKHCKSQADVVLQLDLCGQCMFDYAFRNTLSKSSSSFASLAVLSLRGACRLSDTGLKDIVTSAPALRSINVGQCTLLTCDAINFIADVLGSNLRELYIDGCPKINATRILPALKKFKDLEVLSVAGLRTVTDQVVSEMITVFGKSIKELDFANCLELTDSSLIEIGSNCPDLHSLNISNVARLTDLGMGYLADGCRSIRKLKLCRNSFSDEAMAAFLECSGGSLTELLLNNMTMVGPLTALSLANRSKKLISLDISWCRRISNEALGLIVDSCLSLKLLKVFGCRQITNVFLKGHSNPVVKIIGLSMTPILDHLNLLEPEHVFLRYSPLPICTEV
ncbi:Leucine rich repeat protein [Handroanthus impetiginosus]|uniref:Leucine rich repeat protein n=1 Tax=Handroanthus impetiginosus TaxID=429701 RepID=A0A2G9GVA9_9LAMI|nr:Leucine rich repeat protein [Handroanthus impetiginosus]